MRGKERLGLNSKAIRRQAQLAFERGYSHKKTKGHLRKWIDREGAKVGAPATDYIMYNSHLFIFTTVNGVKNLVTILTVPSNIINRISNYVIK